MRKHIEKKIVDLLDKPEHIRRRTAITIAGCVTALIFIIWVTTLGGKINSDNIAKNTNDKEVTPIATVVGAFTGLFGR